MNVDGAMYDEEIAQASGAKGSRPAKIRCLTKVWYESEAQALAHAAMRSVRMRPYQCTDCGAYHLTRRIDR